MWRRVTVGLQAAFNAGAKCAYFGLSVWDNQALWSVSSAGIARCRVEP
jgi:hypothetical protein